MQALFSRRRITNSLSVSRDGAVPHSYSICEIHSFVYFTMTVPPKQYCGWWGYPKSISVYKNRERIKS